MREITTHHDGHGLTEAIHVIAVDEQGPGGASHLYNFVYDDSTGEELLVGSLQFQKGPRGEAGSVPGVLEGAVLAVLIDRMESFQKGPFPSDEGDRALYHMQTALGLLKLRADKRAKRGVLGKSEL